LISFSVFYFIGSPLPSPGICVGPPPRAAPLRCRSTAAAHPAAGVHSGTTVYCAQRTSSAPASAEHKHVIGMGFAVSFRRPEPSSQLITPTNSCSQNMTAVHHLTVHQNRTHFLPEIKPSSLTYFPMSRTVLPPLHLER
jgi:hypothetical protein